MNILITGGTGFIGSHLTNKLLSLGHKVTILKRSSSDIWRLENVAKKINFVNFASLNDLKSIFANNNFEAVVHLAATYIKQTEKNQEINQLKEANLIFPTQLFKIAIKKKVKYCINTGTCFEYKLSNRQIDEEHEIEPYNFYASTKVVFENVFKSLLKTSQSRGVTLKLFYPYGEKDNRNKVIPQMIQAVLNKTEFNLTKSEQELDFVYVGDVVNAFIKALEFIQSKKYKKYEVFNIGSGKVYKLKYVGRLVEQLSKNYKSFSFLRPYSANEIMYMRCDNKKAKKILKWEPKISIVKGILKTYQYYLKN